MSPASLRRKTVKVLRISKHLYYRPSPSTMKRLFKILAGVIALVVLAIISALAFLFNYCCRRRNDQLQQRVRERRPTLTRWPGAHEYQSLPDPLLQGPTRPEALPLPQTYHSMRQNESRIPVEEQELGGTSHWQPGQSGSSLRESANTQGDAMRRAFNERREARRTGLHERARELQIEGQRHKIEMERLNHEASRVIFIEKNMPGRHPRGTYDLHGLTVKEAEERTNMEIKSAQQRGETEIRLIVGQGIHAPDGVAKLRPAIEKLLQESGIVCERDPANAGELVVQTQRRHGYRQSGSTSSKL